MWRHFLAGKGLSFRTGLYFGESMLVGVATGLVVVAFRFMIDLGDRFIFHGIGGNSKWVMAVLPAVGAWLGYLIIRRFSSVEHVRGTDSAIRAFHHRSGEIPGAVIPAKSVASVLTVSSGGSAGYEGPVTLLGAAVGSVTARRFGLGARAQRILMAAGLAAGIAALFQAPLAGAIFGFEIFYSSSDVAYETLLPCFVASVVSYTIYAYFFGWAPLFSMPPECVYDSGLRLLPYFALAIVVTFGVRFYIQVFRNVEMKFATLRIPRPAKVALGGLAAGMAGLVLPDVLGAGYPVIQASLDTGLRGVSVDASSAITWFACFFILKVVATSFTVGSGGSGGLFAPALACGGALGAAVGLFFERTLPAWFNIHPSAFALVGMAGFLASSIRTPITAIVMVAELSGNHGLLLPAMWVCGISFWLNNGWSLYRSQMHRRESSPVGLAA